MNITHLVYFVIGLSGVIVFLLLAMIIGLEKSVQRLRERVDDGFGQSMELCEHEDCGLQVVRPGKFQCVRDNCPFITDEATE